LYFYLLFYISSIHFTGDGSLVLTNIETYTSTIAYNFSTSGDSGYHPYAITFDSNSNTIYGVTDAGGLSSNDGTIFSYNIESSSYQTLYNFTSSVYADVIVYANNALYVTLNEVGSGDAGAIGIYNLSTSSYTGKLILDVECVCFNVFFC